MPHAVLTVTLKYVRNIKNCTTLSNFGCVEIYTDNRSSLVWMVIKIYRILHVKAVEFPCHKFCSSSHFVVHFLVRNLDFGYLGLSISCVLWYNGRWLWMFFSSWWQLLIFKGILNLQRGVTSTVRHGENITCRGVTARLVIVHAPTHSSISRQHREQM